MSSRSQVLYLSHGGGPLPLLNDPAHVEMVDCLQHIAAQLRRPPVIIVVSAHWETKVPTLTYHPAPELIYDYYGFPEAAYQIKYPCPGAPTLAEQVKQHLVEHGIESILDEQRGFDHGVFVPLKLMYPQADIPCIQLSLCQHLDPAEHIRIGEALSALEDVLIIGSGFSYHNMRGFFATETNALRQQNQQFDNWLQQTLTSTALAEAEREAQLINWTNAPYARDCHPREEHLLPLHVCYGVKRSACSQAFSLRILNKQASMFLWNNK